MDEYDIWIGGSVNTDNKARDTEDNINRIDIKETNYKGSKEEQLIPNVVSECALYLGTVDTCMSKGVASAIGSALGIKSRDPHSIVEAAKKSLNCDGERCVLEKMDNVLGHDIVEHEINANLKVLGPTDSKLLSNINIDSTLQQWTIRWNYFYPYNFHMVNYAQYSYRDGRVIRSPDTLAIIPFDDLYYGHVDGKKYRCVACVINTDTYQGPGQHWMALFADARGPVWSVEFFNSSGNSPAPEWVNWMEKTKNIMENIITKDKINATVKVVKSSSIRHQKSRSECGLYSLFYIWARLNGLPFEYFSTNHIPDQLMFEFRQHLFEDPSRERVKVFDWAKYSGSTKIRWESS